MTDQGTDIAEQPGSELVPSDGGGTVATDAELVPAVIADHEHPGPRTYVLIAVAVHSHCIEVGSTTRGDVNSNLLITMLWLLVP
jgi:hypothetical protein